MVLDGHLEAVFVETLVEPSMDEVKKALREFKSNKIRGLNLPTAPRNPVIVRKEADRPQPGLGRSARKCYECCS